jgi:uncharacterized protein (DUF111 family)
MAQSKQEISQEYSKCALAAGDFAAKIEIMEEQLEKFKIEFKNLKSKMKELMQESTKLMADENKTESPQTDSAA